MPGTYVEFILDHQSDYYLRNHITEVLKLPQPKHSLHCTTVYSKVQIPYHPIDFHTPDYLTALPRDYRFMFLKGRPDLGFCLVLVTEAPILRLSHRLGINLGATWDYPTFFPHITLAYNLKLEDLIEKPLSVPTKILFFLRQERIMELDENWRPVRNSN